MPTHPSTPSTPSTPSSVFVDHTLESAPAASRGLMEAMTRRLGYLPAPAARLAASPQLLDGFLKLSGLFETTTLDPLTREVVILTIATRNACHVCVAMHTGKLTALGADPELIAALRERRSLPDERLDAVRAFTVEVVERAGAVGPDALDAFLAHGYTPRNALEVVLGIGAYTLSTLANRMTDAPLDEQLAPYAWSEPAPAPAA
ncbi:carboxymuconolactone decarboxylase family protein [Streptomyces sparsogenes]|uniref:carboxymuconolactone decarboxylase family protein n=1 Tax=Streptomyces sparsogenes TaxID=67365 RepID=UPI00331DFCD8